MIIFRYKLERFGRNKPIWRPVADISFQDQDNNWIELHPYIDSGADITMIPFEEVPPLLGRTDVFDKFYISFKQTKKIIEFQPNLAKQAEKMSIKIDVPVSELITSGRKI